MSRTQHSSSDTLNGKSLTLKQDSDIGQLDSVVENIEEWTMITSEKVSKRITENATLEGRLHTVKNLWHDYLAETSGFYFADYGVSFTPNEKTTTAGNKKRYWQAQKRVNGKLYRAYAGTSEKLIFKKIVATAKKLMSKIEEAQNAKEKTENQASD